MVFTSSVCRICALLKDTCYSIFDATDGRNVELKMYKCLSVTISENDSKPTEICDGCYVKLNDFYEFMELFRSSDEKFENASEPKASESDCQFNGVIVNNEKVPVDMVVLNCNTFELNESLTAKETSTYSGFAQSQTVLRHSSDFYKVPEKPACGKPVKNRDNFKNTFNRVKNKYVCQHCKKCFTRRTSLNMHLSLHGSTKLYSCEICLKAFPNERYLKAHKIVHTNKYQCEVCLKSFSVPSKHQRHLRTHSQQRLFVCSVKDCGKSFVDKSNLKGHELTHSDKRLFTCNVCNKNYRTGSQLRDHTKAHDNLAAFICSFCGKKYKWKSNLTMHTKKYKGLCVAENEVS